MTDTSNGPLPRALEPLSVRINELVDENAALLAECDALQDKLVMAVTCLQRITWVLDDERGAMEATALAYANTTLTKLTKENEG